jgi:hypothetical protein
MLQVVPRPAKELRSAPISLFESARFIVLVTTLISSREMRHEFVGQSSYERVR